MTKKKNKSQKPIKVHLMDIEKAEYAGKFVETEVLISGKGETYHLPQLSTIVCSRPNPEKCGRLGQCQTGGKACTKIIPPDSPKLIKFTRLTDDQIVGSVRKDAALGCREADVTITQRQTVQELLVVPKAKRIRVVKDSRGGKIDVDETGREYRDKLVFYVGNIQSNNPHFKAQGYVLPNPKNQTATLLITKMVPQGDGYADFRLTKKIKERFAVLQPRGDNIEEMVKKITQDVTDNITNIYGEHRKDALLAILLTYHSIRNFSFDGEPLKRGWIETVLVGDTGQGKTQLFDRLSEATDLGEKISGSSATRTGIAYSFEQSGKSWFLKWGKYPLCDGKLLFLDEGQNLALEDWEKLSSGRSDGLIQVTGVRRGEHSSRTRLIVSANPRFGKIVDEEMFGITLLKGLFRPADARRFDLALILSGSDQNTDVINVPISERRPVKRSITGKLLHDSICWAWTREASQVKFTLEALCGVYEAATRLEKKYGDARDIPLITTDSRHTVARLSVAIAAFLHSTDKNHEKVIVKPEHVSFVENFVQRIYDHPNCGYDLYARIARTSSTLSDRDYFKFLEDVEQDESVDLMMDIISTLARSDAIQRRDLALSLTVSPDWVSKKIQILKKHRLIRVNRGRGGGYQKTAKFNKIIKRMIKEGKLNI